MLGMVVMLFQRLLLCYYQPWDQALAGLLQNRCIAIGSGGAKIAGTAGEGGRGKGWGRVGRLEGLCLCVVLGTNKNVNGSIAALQMHPIRLNRPCHIKYRNMTSARRRLWTTSLLVGGGGGATSANHNPTPQKRKAKLLHWTSLKVLNHASHTLPRLPYTNLKKSRTEKKDSY